jgi:hypothetical protein
MSNSKRVYNQEIPTNSNFNHHNATKHLKQTYDTHSL